MTDVVGLVIVAASLAAGVGALSLLQYLYSQREKSGAAWFMGNISAVAIFCVAYGIGLLVSGPTVRIALEAVAFVSLAFMGPFFLAFGLDYTGRGDLIQTPLFGVVAAVPLATAVLTVTNQTHGLIWQGLESAPVFGLETVVYTIQPLGVFALLFSILTAGIGSLLLIGAVLSYGPLYRREAIAVTLSTVPPTVGVSLWLFGVGPAPQLHLTAPLMLIHIALDGYAFIGTHMFDTNPATQRMAERAGLDSLSDPVFVLDPNEQIVRVNDRAEDLFIDDDTGLPVTPQAVFGATLTTMRNSGEVTVDSAGYQTFAVSYTPLTDSRDREVGNMIVLYDVTKERQREQQLSVLNRVLRHNLRNETSVISGYADILTETITDPEQSQQATTIMEASNRLLSIAENAKAFENIQTREPQPDSVDLAAVLTEIEAACEQNNAGSVVWTTPPACQIQTDQEILSLAVEKLVENGLVHADTEEPTVEIAVSEPAAADTVVIEIRDFNEPIPTIETDSLRTEKETPLQHGQGIGLWIAYWCVQKLRGEITFEYEDGNIVTVTIPAMTTHTDRSKTA